jgi:hypothetical protein
VIPFPRAPSKYGASRVRLPTTTNVLSFMGPTLRRGLFAADPQARMKF